MQKIHMLRERISPFRPNSKGFSLIEVVIVLLIAGIIMSIVSTGLLHFYNLTKQKDARTRLEFVSEAVEEFIKFNGRLPCPASYINPIDTVDFGREASHLCRDVVAAAGIFVNGAGDDKVVIGGVPVRSINIPDEYAFDPWGNRMTYAVTAIQATDGEIYYEYDGKIIVRDSNGNVITNEASHIFVSHGKNGIGAYSEGGGVGKLCNDAPVNERRNCDNDGVFVDTLLIGEDFDDYITFNAAQLINAIIPAGAIVPFDRATCPPGWSAYDEAVGRMVIGIGDDQKDPPAGTPFAGDPLDPAVTTTYDIGDTGGSAWRIDSDALTATHNADDGFVQQVLAFYPNLSPYVALLYCRKN